MKPIQAHKWGNKYLCSAPGFNTLVLGVFILWLLPPGGTVLLQSNSLVVNDMSWNRDGTRLASGRNDGSVEIISRVGSPSLTFSAYQFPVTSLAWSPVEESQLAFASLDGTIRILDVDGAAYSITLSLPVSNEHVRKIRWSPDGVYLASIESHGTAADPLSEVNIWDVSTGMLVQTFADGHSFTDIAWNPAHPNMLLLAGVADREGAELVQWDVMSNTVLWTAAQAVDGVTYVAWHPDGTMFASLTEGQSDETYGSIFLRIHDASTGKQLSPVPTAMKFNGAIAWSPAQYLAVSDLSSIEIWDPTTNQRIGRFQPANAGTSLSWSPDGRILAYAGTGATVEFAEFLDTVGSTPVAP